VPDPILSWCVVIESNRSPWTSQSYRASLLRDTGSHAAHSTAGGRERDSERVRPYGTSPANYRQRHLTAWRRPNTTPWERSPRRSFHKLTTYAPANRYHRTNDLTPTKSQQTTDAASVVKTFMPPPNAVWPGHTVFVLSSVRVRPCVRPEILLARYL